MSEKEKQQPDPHYYSPKQALIVYATNPSQNGQSESKYYIEISDIMQDANRAFIGAGKPVTKESLQLLMDVVAKSDKQTYYSISEIVPTNLLVIDQRPGRNVISWWQPAKRHTLLIKNKPSITAWTPPLVFVVKNNTLVVSALNKNRRPSIVTRLHHAPFFNVYSDHKVCLGNVKVPKTSGDINELIEAWEKSFWNSEFTDNVTGAYTKTDLQRWWRKKRRGKFPVKKLKLSSTNLKAICENL